MEKIMKQSNGVIAVTMDEKEVPRFKQQHPNVTLRKLKSRKGTYRAWFPKNFSGNIL